MGKTIAERLREADETACTASDIAYALGWEDVGCGKGRDCLECTAVAMAKLADAIDEENDKFRAMGFLEGLKGPDKLPDGIELPRFEYGELVKPGDIFVGHNAKSERAHEDTVSSVHFEKSGLRHEPEVFDADGVPIKAGDTVYSYSGKELVVEIVKSIRNENNENCVNIVWCGEYLGDLQINRLASQLAHRKPDTQEAINADACKTACLYFNAENPYKCADCPQGNGQDDVDYGECCKAQILDLLRRQRKLLGGD